MSATYGVKEARIKGDRKPEVNTCGYCGVEVDDTQYACAACERLEEQNEPNV
jgi:hypothetical protein